MAPARDRDRVVLLLQLLEGEVAADPGVEAEGDPEALDEADVHLDCLAREAERGHADEHRAAGVGQLVEDGDLVTGNGELARDGETRRPGTDDRDRRVAGRDERHVIGDARCRVPLDEEPLHGPDGQWSIDVTAAAGAFAGRGTDVGAHRGHGVGFPGQDVALLKPPFRGEVQVATAVGADGTGFLALDVALEPRGVDGLNQELLVRIDGQTQGTSVLWERHGLGALPGRTNLASGASPPQRMVVSSARVSLAARIAAGSPRFAGLQPRLRNSQTRCVPKYFGLGRPLVGWTRDRRAR